MLFFLLLKAAPAMNHPSADDNSSPRKIWLEIDSQILNALFCVTGFGLAPWRFRDWYWMVRVVHFHDKSAMFRLTQQNKGWFRPAEEYEEAIAIEHEKDTVTFNGVRAPPTSLWKLAFVIDMMVLNTALQAVLCYFMWGYNRINRPSWATGMILEGLSIAREMNLANVAPCRDIHCVRLWICHVRWADVLVGRSQGEEDRGSGSQDHLCIIPNNAKTACSSFMTKAIIGSGRIVP